LIFQSKSWRGKLGSKKSDTESPTRLRTPFQGDKIEESTAKEKYLKQRRSLTYIGTFSLEGKENISGRNHLMNQDRGGEYIKRSYGEKEGNCPKNPSANQRAVSLRGGRRSGNTNHHLPEKVLGNTPSARTLTRLSA